MCLVVVQKTKERLAAERLPMSSFFCPLPESQGSPGTGTEQGGRDGGYHIEAEGGPTVHGAGTEDRRGR